MNSLTHTFLRENSKPRFHGVTVDCENLGCLKKPNLGLVINRIIRISINTYLLSIVYSSVLLSIKICNWKAGSPLLPTYTSYAPVPGALPYLSPPCMVYWSAYPPSPPVSPSSAYYHIPGTYVSSIE